MARSQYVYIIWSDGCPWDTCERFLAGVYTVKGEAERDLPKAQERHPSCTVTIERLKNGLQDD